MFCTALFGVYKFILHDLKLYIFLLNLFITIFQEVRNYIEKTVFDHIINNNPVDVINRNASDLLRRMKAQRDEFQKLAKLVNITQLFLLSIFMNVFNIA